MNKNKSVFSLILVTLLLSSCGQNTKDWPRISFSFTADDVIETRMYFHQRANKYAEEMEDSRVSEEKEFAERAISTLSAYPYKEKATKRIDTKNYFLMLDIQFTYFDDSVEKIEKITFYEYDVSDGKVVFNDGDIHYIPGSVYGAYSSIVDKQKGDETNARLLYFYCF